MLKDLVEEAKRRTIVVAIVVLIVVSIMSCLKVHHNVNSDALLVKINFIWYASELTCGSCVVLVQAARSQEFENLFRNEVKDNLVEMADMSHEELSTFVKFFYIDAVNHESLVKHSSALLQSSR
jgi:hypothetical protein